MVYFDVFKNEWVEATSEEAKAYRIRKAEAAKTRGVGMVSREADPEGLLSSVRSLCGVERCSCDYTIVMDKHHADFYFYNPSAIVHVEKNGGFERYREIKKEYPFDDYYIIDGCVCGDTFLMYLS